MRHSFLKHIILLTSIITLPILSYCQNYLDIAKFHYSSTPFNTPEDDSLNTIPNTQIIEFGADLTTPIVLKNENIIISGLIYEQINLKTENTNSLLYTVNPKVGLKFKNSETINTTLVALPKLSSDLKSINSNHFQIGAIALWDIQKEESFKYKFGMYYNSELFGHFIVPLFGFYYLSNNSKFEANFTLPVSAQINYKLTSWLNSGISFNSFVRSYYLGDIEDHYMVKSSNEIYATLQLNLKSYNLIIEPQAGYSIGRSYRSYQSSDKIDFGLSAFKFGDDRTQLNNDFNDGLIFKIRLLYRFMIENN